MTTTTDPVAAFAAASGISTAPATLPVDFEKDALALVLQNQHFAKQVVPIIEPVHFADRMHSIIFKHAKEYVGKYGDAPPPKVIAIALSTDKAVSASDRPAYAAKLVELYKHAPVGAVHWYRDEVAAWAKGQALLQLMQDGPSLVAKKDFDKLAERFRKTMQIGDMRAGSAEFRDYFNTVKERTERRDGVLAGTVKRGVSTGFADIDAHLHHRGWQRGGLSIILAPTKRGKTALMLQSALQSCLLDRANILYISLEVQEDILTDRLDAMATGTKMLDLVAKRGDIEASFAARFSDPTKRGNLYYEVKPTNTLTANGLERIIESYFSSGRNLDAVFVDYLGIMKTSSDDRYKELGDYAKEMRRIAGEYDVAMITGYQTNRDGFGKSSAGADTMGDSFLPAQDCDLMLSINATEAELKAGVRRIHWALARNEAQVTIKIEGDLDVMQIYQRTLGVEV